MFGMTEVWGRRIRREMIGDMRPAQPPASAPAIDESDLAALPEGARRYLRFMGVVGRPRNQSFRLESTGRFRMRPGAHWMECEAWQYATRHEVARVMRMKLRFGPGISMTARDTYLHGHGRMVGKLMGWLTVADAHGEELDQGELVTWLNDAVLIAPSMLLGPETAWTGAGTDAFDVAFTDRGRTVRARVTVDDRGAPTDFSTTDRFRYDADRPEAHWNRDRWSTPVEGWRLVAGRPVFTRGRAVWHTPEGPFVYAEFRPRVESLAFDVPPSD